MLGSAGPATIAGFVLIGGDSRRMGTPKALLDWHGTKLADWVADSLGTVASQIYLVGTTPGGEFRTAMLPDRYPREGPLGAVLTILASDAVRDLNLVVACDMPALRPEFLALLCGEAARSGAAVTLPVGEDGKRHPLCSVYRMQALGGLQRAYDSGERSLLRAIDAAGGHASVSADPESLANINTPGEWRAFRATHLASPSL